ncbi:MAG: hypothetical protein N4A43_05275 [Alphaproteobacteria bacterium]|jgi:glutaredoxin|nr:hypothetical protein [Alphaproteobacteria bacterium]
MINWIKQNKFQSVVLAVLTALFIFLVTQNQATLLSSNNIEEQTSIQEVEQNSSQVVKIFESPYCPHCHDLKDFVESELKQKYPTVVFNSHDITKDVELARFKEHMMMAGHNPSRLGTPTIFINEETIIGFDNPQGVGKKIEEAIDKAFFSDESKKKTSSVESTPKPEELNQIETSFGVVSLDKSLPLLAITLGLVDGFNPCAMWVLIYLISIIMTMKDKKKMWLIVGTFVTAEAILYYILLNFWLSAFLMVGAIRIVSLIIGIVAIYFGLMDLKQYFLKEDMICKVGNLESKNKTKNKIKSLAHAEITVATILSLIGLAFVVNSMEFMCSAGIPAVFSQVLANAGISGFMKQVYIILYDIFFMIDDFIVFGLAIFAIDKYVGDKYMRICKLIGGSILVILGVLMIFFPEYLK